MYAYYQKVSNELDMNVVCNKHKCLEHFQKQYSVYTLYHATLDSIIITGVYFKYVMCDKMIQLKSLMNNLFLLQGVGLILSGGGGGWQQMREH